MAETTSKPQAAGGKAARAKPAAKRAEQVEAAKRKLAGERSGGNTNPILKDETYGELRGADRVVMRHEIALNLGAFRAAPDDFALRPVRNYPVLRVTTAPFLSVIIPNYNGLAYLPALLLALTQQTFQDFEVIVVDDASTDQSVAWLEAHHPEVRLLVNRHNQGFAATCNGGAGAARGRVLVFLNSDTEPEAGWTEALARAICANPQAAIFASKLLAFDRRELLHSAGDGMGLDGMPRNRGVWQQDRGQFDQTCDVFSGCGGAVAYRREIWAALGGFDESFWMYLEDADFAFRAQLLGCNALFVPQARVYHHVSATGGGVLSSYYVGRNTLWLIVKNMPRSLLLRNLPRIFVAQARVSLDALRHWRGAAARARLRGQLAGLLQLRMALAQRRQIQPGRIRDDRELAARLEP
jgi:GT2 family glycosyltransferase